MTTVAAGMVHHGASSGMICIPHILDNQSTIANNPLTKKKHIAIASR